MEFEHKSVLRDESIDLLCIKKDGIYVDGTAGGAGHSLLIAKQLDNGRLFSFDRDPDAVKVCTERLEGYNATVIHSNFKNIKSELLLRNVEEVDGVLLDLGVSSFQLDNRTRGFSYHDDAPLDMRMSKSGTTAAELVNSLSAEELTKIFRDYGEEKFAYKIACSIVAKREIKSIDTTSQLCDIISDSVPAAYKRKGNPSRKCFQALRIAVNEELDILEGAINDAFDMLKVGGIMAIITFHSLEDRIVKNTFRDLCTGCTCPKDFPVCVCGKTPRAELVNRKPIIPGDEELEYNKRARSAKLRAIKKIKKGF